MDWVMWKFRKDHPRAGTYVGVVISSAVVLCEQFLFMTQFDSLLGVLPSFAQGLLGLKKSSTPNDPIISITFIPDDQRFACLPSFLPSFCCSSSSILILESFVDSSFGLNVIDSLAFVLSQQSLCIWQIDHHQFQVCHQQWPFTNHQSSMNSHSSPT